MVRMRCVSFSNIMACRTAASRPLGMLYRFTPRPALPRTSLCKVELIYNGVALDLLGVGYETFPEDVRNRVVRQFPRANFKQEIAQAFFDGFGYKPQTTEYVQRGRLLAFHP